MTIDGDREEDTTLTPDDAFALLGNATRISILQALWEGYTPYAADNAVPFSDLYDQVGISDTGNFNYHLGKLTGHFIQQTDNGYKLTAPGFDIVQSVIAGVTIRNPILEPTVIDATCGRCNSPIEIVYEDGTIWAQCTECTGYWPQKEGGILGFSIPPEGLRNRTPDQIFDATIAYSIHRFGAMSDGVCPECSGGVDASLTVCEGHDTSDGFCGACGFHYQGILEFICNSCKFAWRSPSWAPVHHYPALISFYYDHGVDHDPNSWEAIKRSLEWREELLSTDPVRLQIIVPYENNELLVVLDETGTVIDSTNSHSYS
jgi:hypothetical protein